MKKGFWQSEWQNINFDSLGVPLKFFSVPGSEFYESFYTELFRRYEGYDALPKKWKEEKYKTAVTINEIIKDATSILSVGCGLGFVEKSLIDINKKLEIDAFDFANNANKWLLDIDSVNCITSIDDEKKYQFIYCTQLLYALSDKEISDFSKFIKNHLIEGGIFLTVDTSLNASENSDNESHVHNFLWGRLRNILALIYFFIFKRGKIQFWGWQRDNIEIIQKFHLDGMVLTKKIKAVGQSFLIFRI
tara:strand:- start:45 stop:785 length:741 start_codon:yes stop_codon:yes gene_type:complete